MVKGLQDLDAYMAKTIEEWNAPAAGMAAQRGREWLLGDLLRIFALPSTVSSQCGHAAGTTLGNPSWS